jgi:Na+/glutamate symporter
MALSVIAAFTIILIVLAAGEFVSTKTKAFVPSVFVSAVLFLIGFWTFMPKDLIAKGSFVAPLVSISMYLLLVHMGTLMSLKELLGQWKSVVISFGGVIGICLMTMTIGKVLFGWQTVVVATPPLTGGVVASILMAKGAADKGLPTLAVLATCMYVMQGFVGYPISAFCLKKEAKRVLGLYKNGGKDAKLAESETASTIVASRKKLIPPLPEQYQTPYVILMKLGFVGFLASKLGPITHINEFVICLILGVIFCEIGFLEEKALNKANAFGFLMTVLMGYIFANLSQATPAMLKQILVPLFGIIILGVIGMYIIALILGKLLGFSKEMAFASTLTALYGFPADYILTHEAIKSVCETEDEKEYVIGDMLPKMLVSGFTTVTIASVIIAGFFIKLL